MKIKFRLNKSLESNLAFILKWSEIYKKNYNETKIHFLLNHIRKHYNEI